MQALSILNNPDNYTGVVTNSGKHFTIGKNQRLQITKGRVQIWQQDGGRLLQFVIQFNKKSLLWMTKEEGNKLIHEPII